MPTEKQKGIKEYLDTVKAISKYYDVDFKNLDKKAQKYLKYKYACKKIRCEDVEKLYNYNYETILQI